MKTHKINVFRLWLTDVFLSGFQPPYEIVNERRQVEACYTLPKAFEYSIVSSDGFHYVSIYRLVGKHIHLKYRVDTKGRTRYPKAILRRLGRIL